MLNIRKEMPLVLHAMNILLDWPWAGNIGTAGKEIKLQHTACLGTKQYLNVYKCVNTFHWSLTFRVTL